MLNILVPIAILATAAPKPPHELRDYLAKPDKSFSFHVVQNSGGRTEIQMTSQTWHGVKWNHTLLIQRPEHVRFPHTAILYITGDGPKKGDYVTLGLVTQSTGMPVAMLFDIPNQPIEGRREDDLIAHTFEEYIKRPDPTLPLLFPMAKSAIRALDVVQKFTRKTQDPITRFVVAGASKRGWTTWMVGAADDPRVKAIAPMVIDNLNLPAQMKHQIDSWGFYSEMIKAYTERGLQAQLGSGPGHDLSIIVDPYSYRRNLRVPTLIIKGSNDPYWTVDALDQYWSDLTEPKWILNVPNSGHTLGNGIMAAATIGGFAQSVAGDFPMPKQSWDFTASEGVIHVAVTSSNPPMARLLLWEAQSDTLDFRDSKYKVVATAEGEPPKIRRKGAKSDTLSADATVPLGKNIALFGEMQYQVNGKAFSLSTPTRVFRRNP